MSFTDENWWVLRRELDKAYTRIQQLESELRAIREGYEGCCHACEPVGALNQTLRDENAKLRRHVRSMQKTLLDFMCRQDEELGLL